VVDSAGLIMIANPDGGIESEVVGMREQIEKRTWAAAAGSVRSALKGVDPSLGAAEGNRVGVR
jgi:hypothetical protein